MTNVLEVLHFGLSEKGARYLALLLIGQLLNLLSNLVRPIEPNIATGLLFTTLGIIGAVIYSIVQDHRRRIEYV